MTLWSFYLYTVKKPVPEFRVCIECGTSEPQAKFGKKVKYGRCNKCVSRSRKCPCGKRKRRCPEHGGAALCPCNKAKDRCRIHGGNAYCECDIRKEYCQKHGGSGLCPCGTVRSTKYGDGKYCVPCYINNNPDSEVARKNPVTKEMYINLIWEEMYPDFKWTSQGKELKNDCKVKRRPDNYALLGTHVLILEIDEYQHMTGKGKDGHYYSKRCEEVRINEISIALQRYIFDLIQMVFGIKRINVFQDVLQQQKGMEN